MKICIYGAGAIGGYMGVMLKRGGLDVSLVARGAHLEAIKARGLTLVTKTETITEQMPASQDPRDLGRQDVVIIALKAHQAWEAAENLKPLLGPETAVVTAQNGVPWWYFHGLDGPYADLRLRSVDPGNRQWNAIGPERVIGCTVYPATEVIEPGVVKHVYGDQFGLGEPNRRESERLTRFADALTAGGLKPRLFADIRDDIWLKLWGNLCFNPISALTHATLDVVATEPGTRALARNMMLEAQEIGERLGVTFRVDVERRINGAAGVGAHRTSMLQDLEKGRPLEIDALLGAVQEMGRLTETRTPYIDAVLGLVQQMASVKGLYPTFPPDVFAEEGRAAELAQEPPLQLAAS
ncbi:2-dehydropantoate 2-reductase [Bosea sp. Root483D1]|uniref:2-dehydropantoate 2-reductase n=1 Tax=Bosea sp. Root483D1 TaxID=1736544 RepID=UPI000710E6F7|nr:2-dehydropantoate 2-reductase [Bosea sp. Root483D1]KRE20455.1 2-dehydropantoate 2-reductase [Bosea sp. Root483D1]